MARAYLCTDSCSSFRYDRIRECNHIYPFFHHFLCIFSSKSFIIKHNRYTWMGSFDDIKSIFYQLLAVVCGYFFQMVTKLGAFFQHIEHLNTCSCDRRCKRVGEQVRTTSLTKQIDNLFSSGCISTGSPTECFSECSCNDIHSSFYATVFGSSSAVCSYKSNCMAVIHHNQCVVFISKITDTF